MSLANRTFIVWTSYSMISTKSKRLYLHLCFQTAVVYSSTNFIYKAVHFGTECIAPPSPLLLLTHFCLQIRGQLSLLDLFLLRIFIFAFRYCYLIKFTHTHNALWEKLPTITERAFTIFSSEFTCLHYQFCHFKIQNCHLLAAWIMHQGSAEVWEILEWEMCIRKIGHLTAHTLCGMQRKV